MRAAEICVFVKQHLLSTSVHWAWISPDMQCVFFFHSYSNLQPLLTNQSYASSSYIFLKLLILDILNLGNFLFFLIKYCILYVQAFLLFLHCRTLFPEHRLFMTWEAININTFYNSSPWDLLIASVNSHVWNQVVKINKLTQVLSMGTGNSLVVETICERSCD